MNDNQEYKNIKQLQIEDYLQGNKLEIECNNSVLSCCIIIEINTKTVTNELIEKIFLKHNMEFNGLKSNK